MLTIRNDRLARDFDDLVVNDRAHIQPSLMPAATALGSLKSEETYLYGRQVEVAASHLTNLENSEINLPQFIIDMQGNPRCSPYYSTKFPSASNPTTHYVATICEMGTRISPEVHVDALMDRVEMIFLS